MEMKLVGDKIVMELSIEALETIAIFNPVFSEDYVEVTDKVGFAKDFVNQFNGSDQGEILFQDILNLIVLRTITSGSKNIKID